MTGSAAGGRVSWLWERAQEHQILNWFLRIPTRLERVKGLTSRRLDSEKAVKQPWEREFEPL